MSEHELAMPSIDNAPEPLVSIVLSTYNRRDYLKRCLASIFEQTMKQWELIVVDDGSSDDSWKLLEQYLQDYSSIRLIRHSHRGLALSLNVGILNARAPYITFIDSDDEYLPEHLELRRSFMKTNPEIGIIHGGMIVIGDPFVTDYYDQTKTIDVRECFVGATYFGKREVFFTLGGFRNISFSDTDFMLRAEKQYSVKRFEEKTYRYYRDTPGSMTNLLLKQQIHKAI